MPCARRISSMCDSRPHTLGAVGRSGRASRADRVARHEAKKESRGRGLCSSRRPLVELGA